MFIGHYGPRELWKGTGIAQYSPMKECDEKDAHSQGPTVTCALELPQYVALHGTSSVKQLAHGDFP